MKLIKNSFLRKVIGYFLIMTGVALPLYSFASLSLNYLQSSQRYRSFKSVSVDSQAEKFKDILENAQGYNKSASESFTYVDPFDVDEYDAEYGFAEQSDIFGYLLVPSIDLVEPIYLGASDENLAKGVAHVYGTSLPVGGEGTRSVIAGHRGYYKNLVFLNLAEIEKGAKIYIDLGFDTLVYEVYEHEVIKPWESEKLHAVENEDILTLLTCDPIVAPRTERLLVHAKRVSEIADKPESEVPEADVADDEITEVSENVNKKVIYTTYAVFLITLMGIAVEIFLAYRLIRFVVTDKNFKN